MKINKFIAMFLSVAFLAACSEETVVDEVFDTTTSGAVLRTLESSTALNFFELSTSEVSITLEEQDEQGGDLLERVDVYVGFTDNTSVNGTTSVEEALVESIPASAFTENEIGLPQISYSVTGDELVQALGLTSDQFTGGDAFVVRFELILTDGRTFSASSVSGNVSGGSYFSSPFAYNAPLICPSDLGGTYDYTSTAWCGGSISGTATLVEEEEGVYDVTGPDPANNVEDFDFGTYDVCYGDGTLGSAGFGPEGNLKIQDACGNLSYIGTSQWGEVYTLNSVTVNGSDLTIDWENDYGEAGVTTLTRTDGTDWPPLNN